VSLLNAAFPQEEFWVDYNGEKIDVYLNLIDLDKLRKQVSAIEEKLELVGDNPFNVMVERIQSIGSYGIKSGKRSFVSYNKERKVKDRKQKIEERGMYFYAADNDFKKHNNEFPSEYLDRIILGDSEELLKSLPDNCVDLVFTSPPYNFGLDYGEHKDGVDWNQYFEKLFNVFRECIRVTKYGGRVAINIQPLYTHSSHNIRILHEKQDDLAE
jgi:hypothetical protein